MNRKMMLLPFAALVLCSCGSPKEWTMESFQMEGNPIKNVILMISDGTSANTVNIARDVNGGSLYIDEFLNGSVKTASLSTLSHDKKDQNDNPTDSAAAATAMATGYKTTDRSIGMVEGVAKDSVLKKAQEKNMKTALVTTVGLIDATPAAFYAHTEERSTFDDVYSALLASDVDVLMGDVDINSATETYFDAKDFTDLGYTVAVTKEEFTAAPATAGKFLANFNECYDVNQDRYQYPHIEEYAQKMLTLLTNDNQNGFFAMIEGGAVDHANHNHKAYESITDFLAFDRAVKVVTDFAKSRSDTAVIMCPDHGNGAIKYIKGAAKYNSATDINLKSYLENNTEFTILGHTNEDVYLGSYIPEGISRIGGNKQYIDNTTIAHYMDALLDLKLFA